MGQQVGGTASILAHTLCHDPGTSHTVWDQHQCFFTDKEVDPTQELLLALIQFIQEQHQKGFKVVLGIDANMDTKNDIFQNFLLSVVLKMFFLSDTNDVVPQQG